MLPLPIYSPLADKRKGDGCDRHIPREVRSDDSIGRDSLLDPVRQRREHIEIVRTRTTTAMVYAGRHEESGELQRILTESIDYVREFSLRLLRLSALHPAK